MSDKIKALIPELAEKLAKQRKVCKRGTNDLMLTESACVYDDGKGNHCLVGHIMSKDEQALYGDFEGTVDNLRYRHPSVLSQFSKDDIEIFRVLQEWHDYGQYQSLIDTGSDEAELKDRIEFELNYTVDTGRFWEGV